MKTQGELTSEEMGRTIVEQHNRIIKLLQTLNEVKSKIEWVQSVEKQTNGQDWAMLHEALKDIDAVLT